MATPGFFVRAVLYMTWYAYLQYTWYVHGSSVSLAQLFGIAHAWIGMNVQHDANHGAISRKYIWLNDLLGFGADWIGNSKWLWQQQHWTHHAYTNHPHKDPDAFSAEPLLLFQEPNHGPRQWFHPYQVFYLFPALAMYGFSIVFSDSVFTLQHPGAKAAGVSTHSSFYHMRRYCAPLTRLAYIYVNVVSPFFHHSWTTALWHVFLMFASGSLVLAGLFVVSHNFVHSDRSPHTRVDVTSPLSPTTTSSSPLSSSPPDWYRSQVETSCTYGGTLAGWLTGGLNFQIEHHLFPRMSSAWYPTIAPVVRRVCAQHGVHYTYFPWFHQNAASMLQYLWCMGRGTSSTSDGKLE
jgi:acyl-lipid (7-3)-desaturase (Delta-4 desaturase)